MTTSDLSYITGAKRPGLAAGTLTYTGQPLPGKASVRCIEYSPVNFVEHTDWESLEENLAHSLNSHWVDVVGLQDVETIANFGRQFHLPKLLLEDIVHTEHRPKLEELDSTIFIIAKVLLYDRKAKKIDSLHLSLALGDNYLLSFQEKASQEKAGNFLDPILTQLRDNSGKVRRHHPDFLCYTLIDAIVDNYLDILGILQDEITKLDNKLLSNPSRKWLEDVHKLKHLYLILRKAASPLRDVVATILHIQHPNMRDYTEPYFKDVLDHLNFLIEEIQGSQEMISSMLDMYLSLVNFRANEIMKVLTLLSSFFIPLSFIASVYGMNFQHMPELSWEYGYYAVLLLMLTISGSSFYYFRRRGWFGSEVDTIEKQTLGKHPVAKHSERHNSKTRVT